MYLQLQNDTSVPLYNRTGALVRVSASTETTLSVKAAAFEITLYSLARSLAYTCLLARVVPFDKKISPGNLDRVVVER